MARPLIRMTAMFRGRVQGVGFRQTTLACARAFPITGFVRNERDGSVRCVAEGYVEDLESFFDDLHERMRTNITEADVERSAATGAYPDFTIERG